MAVTACVNCGHKVNSAVTCCPEYGENPHVHVEDMRSDPPATLELLTKLTLAFITLDKQLFNAEATYAMVMLDEFMRHGGKFRKSAQQRENELFRRLIEALSHDSVSIKIFWVGDCGRLRGPRSPRSVSRLQAQMVQA